MPIHPELRQLLAAAPTAPPAHLTATEQPAREPNAVDGFAQLIDFGPTVLSDDYRVAVDGGEITVRLYWPATAGPHPVHLYIHGGSFSRGSIDEVDFLCHQRVADIGCAIASVGYRLAPEHKFPIPPEDCYRALEWLAANAETLNVDRSRISVGGGSAGGALAAAVALMARDRAGPSLVAQVLEMPCTDLTLRHPSIDELSDDYFVTRRELDDCVASYLADPADATHPYASPIFADLTGLPPALVTTAEFDPIRDEGEAFADRLSAAGVPTAMRRWAGHIHMSVYFTRLLPGDGKAYRELIAGTLRTAFGIESHSPV